MLFLKTGCRGRTADPSAALLRSSGRDDKGRVDCFRKGDDTDGQNRERLLRERLQIPPLRSCGAPVGMTRGG
jgi:hypothetical protein